MGGRQNVTHGVETTSNDRKQKEAKVSSKILVSTGHLCRLMHQTMKLIAFSPSTTLHDFCSSCSAKKKKKARQSIFASVKKSFVSTATALSDHYENNKCQSVGIALFVHLLSCLWRRVFQSASPLQTSPILAVSNGDRTTY